MKKILNHTYIKVVFLLIMASLLCFSFFDHSVQNEKRITENLTSITEENNQQTNAAIYEKLKDEIHILQIYATLISQNEDITADASFQALKPLLENELFTRIAITNAEGISFTSDHFQHDSSNRDYYKEGMKGNYLISNLTTSVIDQSDVVVMSVPIYRDQEVIGVLRATLNTAHLHKYFELSFLSGDVSSFIIQSDGRNLTQQQSDDDNFFAMLKKFHNDETIIQHMQDDLQNKKEGSITFQLNDKTRYAFYSPIKNTDWYLLSILPYSTVETELSFDFHQILILAIKIGSILLLVYIYFFYSQIQNAKDLKQVNQRLDAIIANTPGSSFKYVITRPETIIFFKHGNSKLIGYEKNEIIDLIKTNIFSLIHQEDYTVLVDSLHNLKPNTIVTNSYRITNKNNEIQWFYDQRQIVLEGNEAYYYVQVIDITEMKQTQEQLKISEERNQLILKETQSVIFEWNMSKDCISFSELWHTNYGYPTKLENFLVLTNQLFGQSQHSYIPLIEDLVSGKKESDQIECILPKANGEQVWVKVFAKAISDHQGYLLRIVGSISDISKEKKKTIQLMDRAQKDGLTKVYNRITIEHMINQEMLHYPDQGHMMFVIDIDDFKSINDTLGHAAGDEALTSFSSALTSCFRKDDIIGRIGGDEFVIFMRYQAPFSNAQLEVKCQKLLSELSNITLSLDSSYQIHCSIGIAMHPEDGNTYLELFKTADKRLYQAKKRGKNTYCFQDQ